MSSALALIVAGCTSSSSAPVTVTVTTERTPGETTSQATAAEETRLSVSEYQRRLNRSARQLRAAVKRVGQAGRFGQLVTRTEALGAKARGIADTLAGVSPPEEAEAANNALVDALRSYSTGVDRTTEAETSRSLCAASAATARLSGLDSRDKLEAAIRSLEDAGFTMPTFLPKRQPLQDRSLSTGDYLIEGDRSGSGEWEIDNGRVVDAVVAITADGSKDPVVAAYIEAGETLEITGIPDGSYRLYFTLGKDWDGSRFTQKCQFSVDTEPYGFETTATSYRQWTTGLKPVQGGNAKINPVDPDAFPDVAT